MKNFKRIPLRNFSHRKIHYDLNELLPYIEKIDKLLEELSFIHKADFSKKLLDNPIKIGTTINYKEAYNYILKHKEINKDTLRNLYLLLSSGILDEREKDSMGDYYRTSAEFIMKKGDITSIRPVGAKPEKIDYYIASLLDYLNENSKDTKIDNFIKSQIAHLYFVYIHPYPNVNGRTSRTLAMWHLLKNENHPFIIFDRVVALTSSSYSRNIRSIYNSGNITPYLKYILNEIKKEFERIKIIESVNEDIELDDIQKNLLECMLFLSNANIDSLSKLYAIANTYISSKDILENYLEPLIESKIVIEDDGELKISEEYSKAKITL